MELSRRRILTKHLEPARPLRRCAHLSSAPAVNAAFTKVLRQEVDQENSQESCNTFNIRDYTVTLNPQGETVGIEQFYKIVNMNKQNQGRISYTRDFLIGLASCPAAREKPEFLPDHPIVLTKARDPGHLWLHELMLNGGNEEMAAEGIHSP